jgi:hypothetical protein
VSASLLQRALEASEAENSQLREALQGVTTEREEFSQLCQTLRDEMLAVAGQAPGSAVFSPLMLRTHIAESGGHSMSPLVVRTDAPPVGPSPSVANPASSSAYVSPAQIESFRREVQAKEHEVDQLRYGYPLAL